jgi:hypothetical protein
MRPAHLALMLASALTLTTSSSVAQDPVRSQISASLQAPGRVPAFSLFGTELAYGSYRTTASLPRIPCPGSYRFTAVKASLRDGTTAEFVGDLRLRDLEVKGSSLRCGAPLPTRFGRRGARVEMAGVSVHNRDRQITLKGRRSADGGFGGSMSIRSILCPGPYRFLAAFRDARNRRIQISYRFTLTRAIVDGKAIASCR